MPIFRTHVTLYKYCTRNSVAEEAKKQSHPHHVFVYALYENVIN
jgi:hypothetical protein